MIWSKYFGALVSRFNSLNWVPAGALILLGLPVLPIYGQVLYRDGPMPSFEVATVKPLPNGPPAAPGPVGLKYGPTRLHAEDAGHVCV